MRAKSWRRARVAAGRSGRSRLVRVRVQCFPPENRDLVTVREMTEVAPFGPTGHSLLRNSRARRRGITPADVTDPETQTHSDAV